MKWCIRNTWSYFLKSKSIFWPSKVSSVRQHLLFPVTAMVLFVYMKRTVWNLLDPSHTFCWPKLHGGFITNCEYENLQCTILFIACIHSPVLFNRYCESVDEAITTFMAVEREPTEKAYANEFVQLSVTSAKHQVE